MKKISVVWLFTALFILIAFVSGSNTEANAEPAFTGSSTAGSINTHDVYMIREKQREMEEKYDFENKLNKQSEADISGEAGSYMPDYSEKLYKIYDKETAIQTEKRIQEEESKKHFWQKKRKNSTVNPSELKIDSSNKKGSVYIEGIAVPRSNIFTDEEIQNFVNPVIGRKVTFEELQEVVRDINYEYATRGYVTAKAYIPPQTLEGNVVKIDLAEGVLGNLFITGNKYTSSNYIRKRISAKEKAPFQIMQLEDDLVTFNNYTPGVNLSANLTKGKQRGTTDVEVVAHEKFPFHVAAIMDNAGRYTIGELRGGLILFADSLFKQRDRLTLASYASSHSVTPFADYNIPVNKKDGRLGFTFSSGYSEIAHGPYRMYDISSRSFNYSLYYTHPLIRKKNFELTSYTAGNYKRSSTFFEHYKLNTEQITSAETALNARLETKRGYWFLNQGVYQAFPIISSESKYFKYTGAIMRMHDFGHGITAQIKGLYQYSHKDEMPYVDQFQAGGISTVRGYSEGLLIGRSGYVLSGEVMFPIAPRTIKVKDKKNGGEPKRIPFLGNYVKGIVFVDHAGVYPFKGAGPGKQSYNSNDYLVSTGVGLKINLPGDFAARLYWGYPLMTNDKEERVRRPRFHFDLTLSPDFDALLALKRKRDMEKNGEIEKVKADDNNKIAQNSKKSKKALPSYEADSMFNEAVINPDAVSDEISKATEVETVAAAVEEPVPEQNVRRRVVKTIDNPDWQVTYVK